MKRTGYEHAAALKAGSQSARAFGLAAMLLLGCLGFAPIAAKADVYNLIGTIGTTQGTLENIPGYTGLIVTGTLTIDPTQGVLSPSSVSVQNDPTSFTNFYGCPGACTTTYLSSGFGEYGYLDLGSAPFTGTPIVLGPKSYLYLTFQGAAEPTDAFTVTGSLTDVSTTSVNPTPEPSLYGILALFLAGTFVAVRTRRNGTNSGTA